MRCPLEVDQDGLVSKNEFNSRSADLIIEAVLGSAQDCQALELMLAGRAVALDALGALDTLALLLSSTLGLISLVLALAAISGLGRVPGARLRTGSSPKFEAALGRLDR